MPRYFFHVYDEDRMIPDEEGILCEDFAAAKNEAKASALDLAQQAIGQGSATASMCVEIHDETGKVLAALNVAEVLARPISPHLIGRVGAWLPMATSTKARI